MGANPQIAILPVEQGGGWSVDKIKGHVTDTIIGNNRELNQSWDKRMEDFTTKIESGLSEHRKEVSGRLDGQDKVLQTILKEVRAGRKQHDDWHADDLEYRKGMRKEVDDVKREQVASGKLQIDINSKFNMLQWLITFVKGARTSGEVVSTGAKAVGKVMDGMRTFMLALSAFCGTVLVVWSTVRANGIWDSLKLFFKTHAK